MCFRNLPIDFDVHGRATLRDDGSRTPFAVPARPDEAAVERFARSVHEREFNIDPVTRVAGALAFHTVVDLQRRA